MPLAHSPSELRDLRHENETPDQAVGVKAVLSSFKHIFSTVPFIAGNKVLLKLNQKDGIDCPSCAWPDPDVKDRSIIAEYCENGAKAIAEEATSKRVGAVLFQKYSIDELSQKTDFWMGKQGRLTHPMVLNAKGTHYEEISWEGAFELISKELKKLKSPHEATFYTSGRSSNEAAYLYQLFVRQYGTNNLPDCSNMCHESSGVALGKTLGLGKGSTTLQDLENAKLIIVMGQNPGTNAPRMLNALEIAKEKGAKIVSINPLIETGLKAYKNPQTIKGVIGGGQELTDRFLQIKINSDLALMKAILILLKRKEAKKPGSVYDYKFIEKNTQGFDKMTASLESFDLKELCEETGLELKQIEELANWIAKNKKIVICWAMGLTQHKNAVATIQEIVNVLLLRGSIGKKGAGTFPVRGHSNVQGDRTMGIFHKLNQDMADKLKLHFGFDPPMEEGLDVVESIKEMKAGKVKVFMALGGNFLSAAPDTAFTAEALQQCALTVHISTKLNRSHFIHGKRALILPCLARTDEDVYKNKPQFLTTENSTGVVQKTKGILQAPSKKLMSEPAIIAGIAHATLGSTKKINWQELSHDYELIREFIAKTVKGCENLKQEIESDNGMELYNGPRVGKFTTKSGKAQFTANKWKRTKLKKDQLIMMSIRSHDQFNTTIYGFDDRYRGIFNERRVVFMNEADISKFDLQDYEVVNLSSYYDGERREVFNFKIVPYSIPQGCIATYYPETNPLIPISCVAKGSNTPTSKSVIVSIEKQVK